MVRLFLALVAVLAVSVPAQAATRGLTIGF